MGERRVWERTIQTSTKDLKTEAKGAQWLTKSPLCHPYADPDG